jgi:hypothetical protein
MADLLSSGEGGGGVDLHQIPDLAFDPKVV